MAAIHAPFYERLSRIQKTHDSHRYGVRFVVQKDGLIVSRPKLYRPAFPVRGTLMMVVAAFMFKGYILAALGGAEYGERLARLAEGTPIEQAGAWIMTPDALTVSIAQILNLIGL